MSRVMQMRHSARRGLRQGARLGRRPAAAGKTCCRRRPGRQEAAAGGARSLPKRPRRAFCAALPPVVAPGPQGPGGKENLVLVERARAGRDHAARLELAIGHGKAENAECAENEDEIKGLSAHACLLETGTIFCACRRPALTSIK